MPNFRTLVHSFLVDFIGGLVVFVLVVTRLSLEFEKKNPSPGGRGHFNPHLPGIVITDSLSSFCSLSVS